MRKILTNEVSANAPEVLVFGDHDEKTINQMIRATLPHGSKGVLCADGHYGFGHPIGGVVAFKHHISISGVGYDIGCGNLAVETDANLGDVVKNLSTIMDDIQSQIAFGVGRTNAMKVDHAILNDPLFHADAFEGLHSLAANQLGTVGSGNHYVDIFCDELGKIWIGVHFGSRGLGHKIATHFMNAASGGRANDSMEAPPIIVAADTQLGEDYIQGMNLAGRYAYAGREVVVEHVLKILGAKVVGDPIHNHHNFAWYEEHGGEMFWVVRKGATPAFPAQKGFVGGSMGDCAVILEGIESEASRDALYSTVHGAGRIMSRTEARGKFVKIDGKKIRQPGRVRHDEMQKWLQEFCVVLRGGDLDEAPQAYRRLPEVLVEHQGTVKITRTLRPIGVVMAGKDCQDPYRD